MKRIGIKKLLVTGLAIFSLNAAFAAAGFASDRKSDAYYSLNTARHDFAEKSRWVSAEPFEVPAGSAIIEMGDAPAVDVYATNKKGIYRYGSAVIIEKYQVKVLQDEIKTGIKEKDKKAVKKARRKLAKAKLDLFRDQVHLMVDREALKQDYKLVIGDYRRELATDKADLCKAKSKLRKEIASGNEAGVLQALNQVAIKQKEIQSDKQAIVGEKAKLKKDMAFTDKLME